MGLRENELNEEIAKLKKQISKDFILYLKMMTIFTGIVIIGFENLINYKGLLGYKELVLPPLFGVTTIFLLTRMIKNTRILDNLFKQGFSENLIKPKMVSAIAVQAIYIILTIVISILMIMSY